MKRGRKAQPCPSHDEVRRLAALDPRPTIVARELGVGIKAARRWLLEVGIRVKPSHKQRPRGRALRYVKVAWLSSGKRYWVKLYGVWNAMRGRCNSPGTKDYKRYGARGIRVCAEWDSYGKFRKWALANGFRKGLTLDRIDSDGNYEPGNCRWIPKGLQQDNTRRVTRLTLNGVTRPITEWARLTGMAAHQIKSRLKIGWTHEQALTLPIGTMRPGMLRGRAAAKAKRLALMSSESSGA